MKLRKNVNSIAFLNISSVFILQGIAFLSTPIFSRMLGTTQYGQYSVIHSWVTIITCFMGLGMNASIGTGMYQFKDEYARFRTSILSFSALICLVECIVIIAASWLLRPMLPISVPLVAFVAVLSFAHYVVNFAQNAYIYEKKAFNNFVLSVATAVITTGLSIYLVWTFPEDQRYMGRVYGMLIPYVAIAITLLVVLLAKQEISFEKRFLAFGFQVGFPIVFHLLSQTLLAQSDRVMMEMLNISNSEIGIYSLFYTLCSVLTVVLNALNNTWCPFYYDNLSNDEYDKIRVKTRHYIELFSVLAFGFLMLSPEVSLLMGDKSYSSGLKVVPILVSAVFFTFMYQFPVNYEFYHKKTNIIAMGTIGAAIVNIILNYLLIPTYGMFGAAVATSLSYLALFIVHYVIVHRLKGVKKYHTSVIAFLPAIAFVSVGVFLFYFLMEKSYIRWMIGFAAGVFELVRVIQRKSIF